MQRTECGLSWCEADANSESKKQKKASCDQKKASSGVDRIAPSSPCGAVDLRAASDSGRQEHRMALCGKANESYYEQEPI